MALLAGSNAFDLPGAAICGPRCGVRGMTISPGPWRCQMRATPAPTPTSA